MTIGTLKSPNPRNRNSISLIKSKFFSVSSMNTLLVILKVTDARRDVILAGGLYHRFPWGHLPPLPDPGVYVVLITLLVYPVSGTCTAECSFSGMKRLQSLFWKTMTNKRLSSLTILHIHKHKDVIDFDGIIAEFARLKGTLIALCL